MTPLSNLSQSASRVPVMLSENDLSSILHAINETAVIERPSRNTVEKLRTALRRVDPERTSYAWDTLKQIEGDR